jgi:catechol 2,3-dioxygenase-like lactoylglutathione lyase family enzyme
VSDKHIAQVALCALNAEQLRQWYESAFGLVKAGKIFTTPPMNTDRIQGITPNPTETVSWLVDRQDYFQLEFFQFYRPKSQRKPSDWRPCDIGYNMVGIHVADFDKAVHCIGAASDRPLPAISGDVGDRRLCLQDPEGNWVEVMERDPITQIPGTDPGVVRPELPSAVRFMRVSVPDLDKTRNAFVNAMGLTVVDDFQLHTQEHEALWGLKGALVKTALLRSRNFLLELVEYQSHQPRMRPQGYQICDQGFMNIALGYRETAEFDRAFQQATSNGMTPNGQPVDIGIFRVMYVNDPQGFSVEMLNARRSLWSLSGFNPGGPYVENEVAINASADEVWRKLSDHSALGNWGLFKGKVLQPGHESVNGLGCIRELSAFGARITEEIVGWREGSHYTYKLRTGAPFKWHQGDVFVREANGVTIVRWVIRFQTRIPLTGKLCAFFLRIIFKHTLRNFRTELETGR